MRFLAVTGLVLGIAGSAVGLPNSKEKEAVIDLQSSHDSVLCRLATDVVRIAGEQNQASAFCSSYLQIPVVTSTSTSTSFTTTVNVTATVTSGSVITTDATTTTTSTSTASTTTTTGVTDTITVTSVIRTVSTSSFGCSSPTVVLKKREAATVTSVPTPGCLEKYEQGSALSSVCGCLSVSTSTTTTTTVLDEPTTTTITTTVPSTIGATSTTTATQFDTTTFTSTSTSTETVTTNSTSYTATTLVSMFRVYAIGGNHNGDPLYNFGDGRIGDDQSAAAPQQFEFRNGNNSALVATGGSIDGQTGVTDPNAGGETAYVLFQTQSTLVDMTCSFVHGPDGTCPMTCQGSRGNISYDCGTFWRVASAADLSNAGGGCAAFVPYLVG